MRFSDLLQGKEQQPGLRRFADGSARNDHFLIQAAKERPPAKTDAACARQPVGNFLTPQIERKRLQPGKKRTPKIAQRMPPTRQRVFHYDDFAPRFDHAEELAQRPLADMARLLMQQEENQSAIITGIG